MSQPVNPLEELAQEFDRVADAVAQAPKAGYEESQSDEFADRVLAPLHRDWSWIAQKAGKLLWDVRHNRLPARFVPETMSGRGELGGLELEELFKHVRACMVKENPNHFPPIMVHFKNERESDWRIEPEMKYRRDAAICRALERMLFDGARLPARSPDLFPNWIKRSRCYRNYPSGRSCWKEGKA